jgi:hypothetical protein
MLHSELFDFRDGIQPYKKKEVLARKVICYGYWLKDVFSPIFRQRLDLLQRGDPLAVQTDNKNPDFERKRFYGGQRIELPE